MKKNNYILCFTLIEVLTVISIIIILIGIGIPAYNSWRNRAKIEEAKSTIANIEMAMEMYKTDFGFYPQTTGLIDLNADGLINDYLVQSFRVNNVTYGPYMKFNGSIVSKKLLDPWGAPYKVFTVPGSTGYSNFIHNTSSYYIISNGPNGPTGDASDDIDNY